jgi:hypothetical protein
VCVCLVLGFFHLLLLLFWSFSLAQHPPILLDIDSSQPAASLYKRMGPSSCKEVEEEISTVLDTRRRRDERKSSSRPPTTHPPPNIYISSSHLLIHKRLLRGWVGGGRCVGGSSPPPPILLQFSHPFKYQSALRARCVYRWEHAWKEEGERLKSRKGRVGRWGGGFDGSIEKGKGEKKKKKDPPSSSSFCPPCDADVERCDSNVGTSRWLSASRVGRIQLKLLASYSTQQTESACLGYYYFFIKRHHHISFDFDQQNNPQPEGTTDRKNNYFRWPRASLLPVSRSFTPNKFRSSIFFLFSFNC